MKTVRCASFVFLLLLAWNTFAQSLPQIINEFEADRNALGRKYFLYETEQRYVRMWRFYQEWREKLHAINPDKFVVGDKVDLLLLSNQVEKEDYYLAARQFIS